MQVDHQLNLEINPGKAKKGAGEVSDSLHKVEQRADAALKKLQKLSNLGGGMGGSRSIDKMAQSFDKVSTSVNRAAESSQKLYRKAYVTHMNSLTTSTRRLNASIQASTSATAKNNATAKEQASTIKQLNAAQARLNNMKTEEYRQLQKVNEAIRDARNAYDGESAAKREQDRINRRLLDTKAKLAAASSEEAQQLARLEQQLREVNAANRRMHSTNQKSRRSIQEMTDGMDMLAFGIGSVVSAYTALEVLGMADRYTEMANKIAVVSDATTNVASHMQELQRVSVQTRSTLDATSDIYSKMTRVAGDYGMTQQQVLDVVKGVNQAVSMSGATAEGAEGAVIQFAQGIANNFQAAAQEINSINEQTPALSQAMADALTSLGKFGEVGRDDLKRLAEEGKLTAQDVLTGFQNVLPDITEQFQNATRTMRQSWNNLTDAVTLALGEYGRASGVTKDISDITKSFAENMSDLREEIAGAAAAVAIFGVGISGLGLVGMIGMLNPVMRGVLGVVTAISALTGAVVAQRAEAQLFNQEMKDIRSQTDDLNNSLMNLVNTSEDRFTFEISTDIEQANIQLDEYKERVKGVREELQMLSGGVNTSSAISGDDVGIRPGPSHTDVKRLHEEKEATEGLIEAQEQYIKFQNISLAIKKSDTQIAEQRARLMLDNSNKELSAVAEMAETLKEVLRYKELNSESSVVSKLEVQTLTEMADAGGFITKEMEKLGKTDEFVRQNIDLLRQMATVLTQEGMGGEKFNELRSQLSYSAVASASLRGEVDKLYQQMDNAQGATAKFSDEVAELTIKMGMLMAVGEDVDVMLQLGAVMNQMKKDFNDTIDGFDDTSESTRDWAAELKSLKSSLDPVFAANQQYRDGVEVLNKTLDDGAEKTRLLTKLEKQRKKALSEILSPQEKFRKSMSEMVKSASIELSELTMTEEQYRRSTVTRELYNAAVEAGIEMNAKNRKELKATADQLIDIQEIIGEKEAMIKLFDEDVTSMKSRDEIIEYMGDLRDQAQELRDMDAWTPIQQDQFYNQMEAAKKQMKDLNNLAKDIGWSFTSSFEDAIINGKGLRETLAGIAEDIAQIILRQQVTSKAAGWVGDVLGGLDLFGASSGPSVNTSGVQALGYNTGRFADGGYTGDGGKYDPAGIVHAGEFVVKKNVVDRPGVRPMLERLNGMPGYSEGGYVGGAGSGGMHIEVNAPVHVESGGQASDSDPASQKRLGKYISDQVSNQVLQVIKKESRPGGSVDAIIRRKR